MQNKFSFGINSYLSQLLGDRFEKNKDIIERVGYALVTESDFKTFIALTVDLFESGFLKASEEYKKHFEKLGYKIDK